MGSQSEFSAAPISDEQLVAWPRIAAVSAMVSFSLPTFITGLEVYQGMSVQDGILAMIVASLLLTVIGGIMGAIGAKTRLSSYLLVKIAFGNLGAGIVNLAFAVSLIGWFGVNIDLFSEAVIRLVKASFNMQLQAWPIEIFAGICMVLTTIYGFKAINILATLLAPILAIITGAMLFQASQQLSFGEFWVFEKSAALSFSDGVAAIVGAIIIGTIILPDITRFSRQWTGGLHTAFWAYFVVELVVMLVIAFAAAAMGMTDILDLMGSLGIGISAFFIVIAGSWILNSLNLYSTVLSVEATFPSLKGKLVTGLLGAAGVIAAFFNILDMFISFLTFLAAIFVPVAGIIITDYLLLNRQKYNHEGLQQNRQVSIPAIIAWALGAAISAFSQASIATGILVLDAIMVAAIVYGVLTKLLSVRDTAKGEIQ